MMCSPRSWDHAPGLLKIYFASLGRIAEESNSYRWRLPAGDHPLTGVTTTRELVT